MLTCLYNTNYYVLACENGKGNLKFEMIDVKTRTLVLIMMVAAVAYILSANSNTGVLGLRRGFTSNIGYYR